MKSTRIGRRCSSASCARAAAAATGRLAFGDDSGLCADALGALRDEVAADDAVIALISGGTSALIGAPEDGVRGEDLATLTALLLESGLPIRAPNAIRKRFARWGAGRLGLAFAPTPIHPVILSDVVGDDPTDIASGPFSADPLFATQIEQMLREHYPTANSDSLTLTARHHAPFFLAAGHDVP